MPRQLATATSLALANRSARLWIAVTFFLALLVTIPPALIGRVVPIATAGVYSVPIGAPVLGSQSAGANSDLSISTPGEKATGLAVTPTNPLSHTVYLPFIEAPRLQPSPLGTVTLISGPVPCDDEECYVIDVGCQQLSRSERAQLIVGAPTGEDQRGTIIFASGWTGTYPWGIVGSGEIGDDYPLADREQRAVGLRSNHTILDRLRAAGFRTVQLVWTRNWFEAELGHAEGMAQLACKPATAVRWVYDHIHNAVASAGFCAAGHSNGASQISYGLAVYGLAEVLDAVFLESGPNWSRIDTACLHDDPARVDLFADRGERSTVDWGFGFNNDGMGPCANLDASYRSQFQAASLLLGAREYGYPRTLVSFIFGGADTSTTVAQAERFYVRLISSGSPWVNITVVEGAPHFVTSTPQGAEALEGDLLTNCRPH